MADEIPEAKGITRRQVLKAGLGFAGLALGVVREARTPEMSEDEVALQEVKKHKKIGLEVVNSLDSTKERLKAKQSIVSSLNSMWNTGDLDYFSIVTSDSGSFVIQRRNYSLPVALESLPVVYPDLGDVLDKEEGPEKHRDQSAGYIIHLVGVKKDKNLFKQISENFALGSENASNSSFILENLDEVSRFLEEHGEEFIDSLRSSFQLDSADLILNVTSKNKNFNGVVERGYQELIGPYLTGISVVTEFGKSTFDEKGALSRHHLPVKIDSALQIVLRPNLTSYDAEISLDYGSKSIPGIVKFHASEQESIIDLNGFFLDLNSYDSETYRDLKASTLAVGLLASANNTIPKPNL